MRLESCLSSMPVGFHWSRTDDETINLALQRTIHVLVLDDRLPPAGGLTALRRLRDSGLEVPCLMVSPQPDARLLRDAMWLGVFTVLEEHRQSDDVLPTLMRLLRRAYNVDWTVPENFN